MKRFIINILKGFSILLGCLFFPFAIIALIDPVGTKMADDGDPFGDPGGPGIPVFMIIVSLVMIFWPLVLKKYLNSKKRTN